MSRMSVDHVIARLLGEESFRRAFLSCRATSLRQLRESGLELTEGECERLRTTNWALFIKLAESRLAQPLSTNSAAPRGLIGRYL